MNILIAGASGLIGSELIQFFLHGGHHVTQLVRQPVRKASSLLTGGLHKVYWQPEQGQISPLPAVHFDAVINLCGENIAAERWSEGRKFKLIQSRIETNDCLSKAINSGQIKTTHFISASAIGIYGAQRADEVDEASAAGNDFLASIVKSWELAAQDCMVPTTYLRFGVVLSRKGGMLHKLLPAYQFNLAGKLGHGQQMISWVSMLDVLRVVEFVITHSLYGVLNVVAPKPVTQQQFSQHLAKCLHRKEWLPMPAWLVNLLFGEMGQALLLNGPTVRSVRLTQAGFVFKHHALEPCLQELLHGK